MREFAVFDRRGKLLWCSANYFTAEMIGMYAWEPCQGVDVETIQHAVGKALVGIPSTTKVMVYHADKIFETVAQWYPSNLLEVGCFATWRTFPESISRLTMAERVVAYWVGMGLPRKAIAAALKVTVSTIDTHKLHIREKINEDSDGLVRWCVEYRALLAPTIITDVT